MLKFSRIFALFLLLGFTSTFSFGQAKTIHVFVALCDNQHQGIVPVPAKLGNGQDPKSNLYWGAAYGIKSYFRYKTKDWKLIKTFKKTNNHILERVIFKHNKKELYLLADAYNGKFIKQTIEDFLKASNGQKGVVLNHKTKKLYFGGKADLLAYIGHDGLMDFKVKVAYQTKVRKKKDVIILACYSKSYFSPEIKKANANPLLWTTHLMAPEAYTLKSVIDGWMKNETGKLIVERAAKAYHKYQKCGMKGARRLFCSGY